LIFVTIGSMLPFDRLIAAMDQWAGENSAETVFFQIGDGAFEPKHGRFARIVPPGDYRATLQAAELVVAHAGMGSAISAAEIAKPIVLLPRRADLREHTTDHQAHTARWLRGRDGIFVADTEHDLPRRIAEARASRQLARQLEPAAPETFTSALRDVIVGRRKLRGA
jgi:UDP-N-acetylglucosamine transferase subunit ALG13